VDPLAVLLTMVVEWVIEVQDVGNRQRRVGLDRGVTSSQIARSSTSIRSTIILTGVSDEAGGAAANWTVIIFGR
jgi:hypothetical protein